MWKGIPVLCFHHQTHLRPLVLNSVGKQYDFAAGDINCSPHQEEVGKYIHRGRLLGSNTSLFGPGLAADEYQLYFLVDFPLFVCMCVCMLVAFLLPSNFSWRLWLNLMENLHVSTFLIF